jgi:hypothetical protein
MAQEQFFLVSDIVAGEKYFDVSRAEILRSLDGGDGKCEHEIEHEIETKFGSTHVVVLRLNINCKGRYPESWSVALKLAKIRVDGVDHEARFDALDGSKGRGWHRHIWSERQQNAERQKVAVSGLDGIDSRETFLIRVFKLMNITLNAADYGTTEQLQFDKT